MIRFSCFTLIVVSLALTLTTSIATADNDPDVFVNCGGCDPESKEYAKDVAEEEGMQVGDVLSIYNPNTKKGKTWIVVSLTGTIRNVSPVEGGSQRTSGQYGAGPSNVMPSDAELTEYWNASYDFDNSWWQAVCFGHDC